jgi:hypothetical protein
MRPKSLSLAGAVALSLIVGAVIPATAQPTPGLLETVDSVFVSQAGDTVAAQYGFLWVQENRAKQNDRMIRLGFVRFPSASTRRGDPVSRSSWRFAKLGTSSHSPNAAHADRSPI